MSGLGHGLYFLQSARITIQFFTIKVEKRSDTAKFKDDFQTNIDPDTCKFKLQHNIIYKQLPGLLPQQQHETTKCAHAEIKTSDESNFYYLVSPASSEKRSRLQNASA